MLSDMATVTPGSDFLLANPTGSLVRCGMTSVQWIILNASIKEWRRCCMAPYAGVPVPSVVWSSDEDEPDDGPASLAFLSQLRQLVQALWRRLPAEVQAIIAGDLR